VIARGADNFWMEGEGENNGATYLDAHSVDNVKQIDIIRLICEQ
jgi:hypothetical protein